MVRPHLFPCPLLIDATVCENWVWNLKCEKLSDVSLEVYFLPPRFLPAMTQSILAVYFWCC